MGYNDKYMKSFDTLFQFNKIDEESTARMIRT
jgi:hypothetical protein